MYLGLVIMTFLIYYIYVAFVGGFSGVRRGLSDTRISEVNMKPQHMKQAHQVDRDSEQGIQSEVSALEDAGVMFRVFGEKWRKPIWDNMVDALQEDSLIDTKAAKKLKGSSETGKIDVDNADTGRILGRARLRLGFFFQSIRQILLSRDFVPYYEEGKDPSDAIGEAFSYSPSLTQIIPVYGEEGLYTSKKLRERDHPSLPTTLEFLISQFVDEWEIFALNKDLDPKELFMRFNSESTDMTEELEDAVREWASCRAQTVFKTVLGAVNYHRALRTLIDPEASHLNDVMAKKILRHVQLLLSHQTYGQGKKTWPEGNRCSLHARKVQGVSRAARP
jgi:hypothetical protein